MIQDPLYTYKIILIIASFGTIMSTLEWLSLWKSFKDDSLFSWRIRKLRTPIFEKTRIISGINKYPNILFLLFLQLLSGIFLIILIQFTFCTALLAGIIGTTSLLLSLRAYMGYTGADQMLKITFITSSISLFTGTTFILNTGLVFLSLQLILSYFTPGILRVSKKEWFNGTHLLLITRQETYGNRSVYNFFRTRRTMTKVVALAILLFECSSIFVLLLPTKYILIYLAIGVIFHFGNAVIMGLNIFLFAFPAVYPAYFYCSLLLKSDW